MNNFFLICLFFIFCQNDLCLSQNEKRMEEYLILENESCINNESITLLKKYIKNLKEAFNPSSFGPPYPVKIYYETTIKNIKVNHFEFYYKNKEIEREEIYIRDSSNSVLAPFSYCILLKDKKIKLKLENEKAALKHEHHFCELIKKIKSEVKKNNFF